MRPLAFVVLGLALGSWTGCVSAPDADSPFGSKFQRGYLIAVSPASPDQLTRAAFAAYESLGMIILDAAEGPSIRFIEGRTADLRTVKTTLRTLSPDKTEVRIRIDSFGSEELSERLWEQMDAAWQ